MARKAMIFAVALALLAAACGDDDGDAASEIPSAAGACLEGAEDCNDTPGTAPDLFPGGEPDDGAAPGADQGLVVGGGLTVSEALETDADGTIAVTGFYFEDESGLRLCELLLESFPPQCGGAQIALANGDAVDPDDLDEEQGVTWSPSPVTVLGEIVDGVLQPTPMSA
jgi:hypothetical protein